MPLAGRAPHRPEAAAAATRSRALRSAEEKATQRSRSRGPTASEPVRPPPTLPARPGRRAAHSGPAAGAPGLGGGCSRAARARRGHLPGSHPASAGVWPQRQRRRNARPSGRGGTGGVTTLKGSAPLVKAPPGHSEMYVFGARGCPSWSPPLPSLPFSAVGLLFSTPSCTESSCVF